MDNNKLCKIRAIYLWILLLFLNILVIGVLASTFLVKNWVYQDLSTDYDWSGSLREQESGFAPDKTYSVIAEDYCDKEAETEEEAEQFDAVCEIFTDLEQAGDLYFTFGIMSGAGLVLNLIVVVSFFCELNCMGYTYFSSFCSLVSLLIGLLCYLIIPKLTIDDCNEAIIDGSYGKICMDTGVFLAIAAAGLLIILTILDYVMTCFFFNKWKVYRPPIVRDAPENPEVVIAGSVVRVKRSLRPQSQQQVIHKEIVASSNHSHRLEDDEEESRVGSDEEDEKQELSSND